MNNDMLTSLLGSAKQDCERCQKAVEDAKLILTEVLTSIIEIRTEVESMIE